jgi:hypothetical protein
MGTGKYFLSIYFIFTFSLFYFSCKDQSKAGVKADVTGNWQITISVAEGIIPGKGFLTQSGDTVSGWVGASENDPIKITGMFMNGRLTIKTLPQPERTVAFDKVDLIINADTMSGKIEKGSHGKGTIKFVKSR